ncbi:hypothetical protein CT085_000385, partial [Salmonella enterica subsp. enterica serovar Thompson]|nr:hypothetical protein [Salmonella enterica subsp. enterica serovar Thompson]
MIKCQRFCNRQLKESIMNLLNLKNTLQTSLVIRLTFLFLLTTIIIWLLSVLIAAYISMVQK